jgi:hypothetical protein
MAETLYVLLIASSSFPEELCLTEQRSLFTKHLIE